MSKNHRQTTVRNALRRGLTALLCIVMLSGLLPGTELSARADDSWATPYLDQLAGWGVMRGDINGNLHPERNITRAEFVTMMNRAYGYDEMGGNPFTDVATSDWFYDDIDIAYNVGYFNGTSPNTASPDAELTREQAAVLLARNMMLQGTAGETLGFTDSRELSDWSRGLIGAVAKTGVVNGYGDGSFRPKNNITRGEVAAMLSRAVGTLINHSGSESLGSVYGNLTINSSAVSLRNTTVVGNLYLTGGIGLGDVLLENVDVYGEIIVAGAGESNSANSSVIMRNVTANDLIVDNISNQFVTVRAEGDTRIAKTSVRTNAYVEDTTPNGFGLSLIELDGEQGTRLQLAGNIKEVKNLTPLSSLEIVQGSAGKVTSDEHATGSAVRVETGARVDELNLDVGASVSGDGDIGAMNVGAAGTNVNILPDNITVRPGITSNITGTTMNNVTAAESSADPRLLSGYPAVRSVAPNSCTLVFATNKAGTVYWAVSALADGSVSEDDLITNPAYGGNIFRSGRINAAASKTEYTALVSGLAIDGSYYVSAILVDSRGNHSPLKVTAFSTPDNTTPAFTSGYPTITRNTTKTAQVTVMTNKSCQMYYALLPRGSSAPTAQEFKSGAVTGNLGYGVVDVVKNNTQPVNVNSAQLEEQTNYTLYLWLNDYDNARSSGVRSLNFTTPDETAPVVTDIMQTDSKATSVDVTYTLNEPGTVYWSIVAEGNDTFMNYELNTTEAKVKTEAGYGALRKGSSSAARADTAVRMAISGLNSRTTGTTSYDVYYIAKDRSGNYAESVGKINVRTLDAEAPTVTQEFTEYNDDNKNEPLANTDIRLVFSENVQGDAKGETVFTDLYRAVENAVTNAEKAEARNKLASALREHIAMYNKPAQGQDRKVVDRSDPNYQGGDWTVDYRFATVSMEEGKMVITLPTKSMDPDTNPDSDPDSASALNMDSGARYYFIVSDIYDRAMTPNRMGNTTLPTFQTVFARVALNDANTLALDGPNVPSQSADDKAKNDATRIDFNFTMDPLSVDRVDKDMRWDMLLWTDTAMTLTLYRREIKATPTGGTEETAWENLGQVSVSVGPNDTFIYRSVKKYFTRSGEPQLTPVFDSLQDLKNIDMYEYAVHVDKLIDSDDFTSWNHNVSLRVSIVAGTQTQLNNLSTRSDPDYYNEMTTGGGVSSIGTPDPFVRRKPFTDTSAPKILEGWPTVEIGDISATINVMLDRPGSVSYIVFPLTQLMNGQSPINRVTDVSDITSYTSSVRVEGGSVISPNGTTVDEITGVPKVSQVPALGARSDTSRSRNVYNPDVPSVNTVIGGNFTSDVIKGSVNVTGANVASPIILSEATGSRLSPNTVYLICMVTRGTSAVYSNSVTCYHFVTLEAVRPTIDLTVSGSNVKVTVDRTTALNYFLVPTGQENSTFLAAFFERDRDDSSKIVGSSLVDKSVDGSLYSYEGQGETMTALEAMATKCYESGTDRYVGSVFDIFANITAKNQYAALIRNQRQGGDVTTGNGSFTEAGNDSANRNWIDCDSRMKLGIDYTLLAVGSSADGSGDAFRAVYPISKADNVDPVVVNASIYATSTDGGFTGSISLVFNEQLYAKDMSQGTQRILPLDNCSRLGGNHLTQDKESYVALGSVVSAMNPNNINIIEVATDDSQHGTAAKPVNVSTIEIKFTKAAANASVSFSTALCDAAGNNHTNRPLTVTLTYTPPPAGSPEGTQGTYGYTISSAWNGMR